MVWSKSILKRGYKIARISIFFVFLFGCLMRVYVLPLPLLSSYVTNSNISYDHRWDL